MSQVGSQMQSVALFASAVTGVTVSIVLGGLMTVAAAPVVAAATPVIRDYMAPTAP